MTEYWRTDRPPPANAAPPPPPAVEDPAGFMEVLGASWRAETIRTDAWEFSRRMRDDLALRMFDMLPLEARRKVADRQFHSYDEPGVDFAQMVVEEAAKHAAADPTAWAGLPLDAHQLETYLRARKKAQLDEAQAILDRPGGGLAEFVGSSARAMTDEFNLALAPLGLGTGGALRTIGSEALLGAAGEALVVPRETDVARELGLPDPDPMSRILAGAALGGGLSAGLYGAFRFGQHLRAKRAAARATAPDGVNPQDHETEVKAAEARLAGRAPLSQSLSERMQAPSQGAALSLSDFDFSLNGNASPRTNRVGYVFGRLLAEGMEPHIAAGFVGNFMQESGPGLNPAIRGDGGAALGIAQWNDRLPGLEEFARKRGKPPEDLDTQIAFVLHELNGSEAAAWAKIRTAKTAEEAAVLISELYERPGVPHMNRRLAFAATVHDQYSKGIVPVWRGATIAPGDVPAYTTSRGYTGAGQVGTSSGRSIDVTYEVVDASLLRRASGDLQPRDRSRAASDAWIAETAARLDPAQLMPSPNAATGTPIVGPDNVIESGNGRFSAIEAAYERFPDRAENYRRAIEAMTGQPIPEGIERPVLVARRTSELDPQARRQFVIDAQDSGVARMTPTEIARVSARAMTPDLMSRLDPEAGLFDPRNADVLRAALAALPASERNALFNPDGGLNKAGQARLQEAMFARAWDAPDILTRFTETDGGELKSLLDALDQAAPAWAALKADIEAGRVRPEADIGPFVLDAMRLIAAARDQAARDGLPTANALAELLDQPDLLEGALSPLTVALIGNKFWKNGRAAGAGEIADFLRRYAAEARKVATVDNMFAAKPADILRAIDPAVFGDLPDHLGTPRTVVTRAQRPDTAPPMPEDAWAKGADSPEAEEADRAALEALRSALDPGLPDLTEIEAAGWVRELSLRQPFDDLDEGYRRAAAPQARLVAEGERIADALGIEFEDPGLKDRAAAAEKIGRKAYGSARQLTDISRGGFVVSEVGQADEVVARLARVFDLIDEGWTIRLATSYVDRKIIIRHPDGMLSEVQIWTPEMHRAKVRQTETYEALRGRPADDPEVMALIGRSAADYSAAMSADGLDAAMVRAAGTSSGPKLFAKAASSASAEPTLGAVSATSTASTSVQGAPRSSLASAKNAPEGLRNSTAGRPSQLENETGVIGGDPSVKDTPRMGAEGPDVNSLRAEMGDLSLRLDDGSEIRAADLLDDIEADAELANVLDLCNVGGQA